MVVHLLILFCTFIIIYIRLRNSNHENNIKYSLVEVFDRYSDEYNGGVSKEKFVKSSDLRNYEGNQKWDDMLSVNEMANFDQMFCGVTRFEEHTLEANNCDFVWMRFCLVASDDGRVAWEGGRSLRVPKKPKPPKPPASEKPTIFLISQESSSNLQILQPIQEKSPPAIFSLKTTQVTPCSLVQIFNKVDAKPYSHDWSLTSFERKLRCHKTFGAGLQPHEKLLCPQQASQVEMRFTSTCSTDVIVQVQAPNGEFSSYLRPVRDHSVAFTPTKVGCGHGLWRVYIALRVGCRFRHMRTEEIYLKGQGVLVYNVEPAATIRLMDRLWLNWLM